MNKIFKTTLAAGIATVLVVPLAVTSPASAKVPHIRGFHHSGGGAGMLFGGVSDDGGGIRIKKGHIIKVPPWDPGVRVGVQRLSTYR